MTLSSKFVGKDGRSKRSDHLTAFSTKTPPSGSLFGRFNSCTLNPEYNPSYLRSTHTGGAYLSVNPEDLTQRRVVCKLSIAICNFTQTQTWTLSPPPSMSSAFFATDDGDIILRAGQEPGSTHDFRVHKFVLSLGSPVFKDMFTFPQPPAQNHNEQSDIPTVNVLDSPQVLDTILRFIYPGVKFPTPADLSIVSALLFTTDKYNIMSIYIPCDIHTLFKN